MPEIRIVPNVPQTLSLQSSEGDLDDTGRVHFVCSDGRELVASPVLARKIGQLGVRPGESFTLRKDWSGEAGDPVAWVVWLTPDSERARAATEQDGESEIERKLVASIAQARERKQPQVGMADLATGTDGPLPQRKPARMAPPDSRVPFNVAFREVVGFVSQELKDSGEQWSDQARQDLVSTVLISASKQGLLKLWERRHGS